MLDPTPSKCIQCIQIGVIKSNNILNTHNSELIHCNANLLYLLNMTSGAGVCLCGPYCCIVCLPVWSVCRPLCGLSVWSGVCLCGLSADRSTLRGHPLCRVLPQLALREGARLSAAAGMHKHITCVPTIGERVEQSEPFLPPPFVFLSLPELHGEGHGKARA